MSAAGSLWDRLTEVVSRQGDRVAVHEVSRSWTYAELHARADSIAAYLDEAGAGDRVACALAHGGEMIAGLLGVLAGGRAYVPIDPTHPIDRSTFVLADSGASAVLTDPETAAFAERVANGKPVLCTDRAVPGRTPRRRPQPTDLAYCLYTSGSTGRPKGVLQRHANVVALLDGYSRRLELVPTDVITLMATFAFDAAVVDVFSTLLSGATLVPYELRARGLADLPATLAQRGVTIYHSTPTVWRALTTLAPTLSPSIRAVVLGGEEVVPDDVARMRTACGPKTVLVNGYGMTECSWALLHVAHPGDVLSRPTIPLGLPIDGVRVTLRTAFGVQRTVNGIGTICIESPFVAEGYHHRPEETAAAFPKPGTYLTTDLGRLLPGGHIEFAGREAHHVKLRGHRIDVREVEAVLGTHPDVAKAVVALHDGAHGPELVGYVVAEEGRTSPGATALRDHLSTKLPDYMIPAFFVPLATLPLGATGKLDRRGLPPPEGDARTRVEHVEPTSPVEVEITKIWCDLLRVERVGIDDNFFARGGHSLVALRVLAQIERSCGARIPLREFMAHPTVRWLAQQVGAGSPAPLADDTRPPVRPHPTGRGPMLAPQRGTYILSDAGRDRCNELGYSTWIDEEIDLGALEWALQALRDRHSILRTRFFTEGGAYWQEVLETIPAPILERADLSGLPERDQDDADATLQERVFAPPWDLGNGEVVRALLVTRSPTRHRLTVVLHHIVSDPQSRTIFQNELEVLWRAYAADPPRAHAVLPPPAAQYIDLVDYLERLHRSPIGDRQRAYWHAQVAGAVPLELPTDHPRAELDARRSAAEGGILASRGGRITRLMGPDVTSALERFAGAHNVSVLSVLLAAMASHLTATTGQLDLTINSHLQFRHVAGMERSLGTFANALLMRISSAGAPTFSELVSRTHGVVTDAFDHGEFDLLALAPGLFRMFFNYHYTADVAEREAVARHGARSPAPIPIYDFVIGYDLTLQLHVSAAGVVLTLIYNKDLFGEASAVSFLDGYLASIRRHCVDADPARLGGA